MAAHLSFAQIERSFHSKNIQERTESWRYCSRFVTLSKFFNLCTVETRYRITLYAQAMLLRHSYFCCQSGTRENNSMLISTIFLYVAGVIFILYYVWTVLFINIIFRVWSLEVTSLISGNHKSSRNMFFKTAVCQISLTFAFHQEYFDKVIRFDSKFHALEFFNLSHISFVKHTFEVQSGN